MHYRVTMITPANTAPKESSAETVLEAHLPFGLVGLPDLRRFHIAPIDGSWPFLSMQPFEDGDIRFLAIQPQGVVVDYRIELTDEDALSLGIVSAADAYVFNIVTVHSMHPQYVTVNLVGPVLVNRATLVGRQVIIENSGAYSTVHPLIDERSNN